MKYRYILFLILGLDALMLFYQTTQLSISYDEATLLYGDSSFIQKTVETSLALFGENDFALRLPMIIFHLLSGVLLYDISKTYIVNERNRVWLVLIFVLLPGVMSSAIVVNSAGFVIFGLFLFLYIYKKFQIEYTYFLLLLFSIVEQDFIYLFFTLAIYSIYSKNRLFLLLNTTLTFLSLYLHGFEIKGAPSGYFLDTLAVYSAVFTPIIFIYLFYTLYRKFLIKDIDILWFISSIVLVYALVISFRQRIGIENLAPYLIIALPLAAKTFISSYRVRLKRFRTNYRNIFILSFIFLVVNTLVVFFNKEIYLIIEKPKQHFAYKMHIVKELARELEKRDIHCVDASPKISLRLKFYGITSCSENILKEENLDSIDPNSVTVSYKNKIVYSAYVTKINNE